MTLAVILVDEPNAAAWDIGGWTTDLDKIAEEIESTGNASTLDLAVRSWNGTAPLPVVPVPGMLVVFGHPDAYPGTADPWSYLFVGKIANPPETIRPDGLGYTLRCIDFQRELDQPVPRLTFNGSDHPDDTSRIAALFTAAAFPAPWDPVSEVAGPFVTYPADDRTPVRGKVRDLLDQLATADPAGTGTPARRWDVRAVWTNPYDYTWGVTRILRYYSATGAPLDPVPLTDDPSGQADWFADTFARGNSSTSLGAADTTQAWEVWAGTWGVNSHRAYLPAGGADNLATAPRTTPDGTVQGTMVAVATDVGLAFRVAPDATSGAIWQGWLWVAQPSFDRYALFQRVAGAYYLIDELDVAPANGDVLVVTLAGAAITAAVLRGGSSVGSVAASSAFQAGAAFHGLVAISLQTSARWAAFSVRGAATQYSDLLATPAGEGLANLVQIEGPGLEPTPVEWDPDTAEAVSTSAGAIQKTVATAAWDAGATTVQALGSEGGEVVWSTETRLIGQDTFSRADNPAFIGGTETGQDWVRDGTYTWGTLNQRAYCSAGSDLTPGCCVADFGVSTGIVEVTFAVLQLSSQQLVLRETNAHNYLFVRPTGTAYQLVKRVVDTETVLGSWSTTPHDGDVIKVSLEADQIQVYVNGTLRIGPVTESFNQGSTRHGLGITAGGSTARWDGFTVRQTFAARTLGLRHGGASLLLGEDTFTRPDNSTSLGAAETGQPWVISSSGDPVVGADAFTRADGPLGTAETGGAWTHLNAGGTGGGYHFGIGGHQALATFYDTSADFGLAVLDVGAADGVLRMTLPALEPGWQVIAFRVSDAANFLYLAVGLTDYRLYRRVAGVDHLLATLDLAPVAGVQVRIQLRDSQIGVTLAGIGPLLVATTTFNQTATQHGFGIKTIAPVATGTARWDDFSFSTAHFWGVSTHTARLWPGAASGSSVALVDAGSADVRVAARLSVLETGRQHLVARATDADNGLFVVPAVGAYKVYKRDSGLDTLLATGTAVPAAGDTVEIRLSSASVAVWVNGVLDISTASSFNLTTTTHGLGALLTGSDGSARWDNFAVRTGPNTSGREVPDFGVAFTADRAAQVTEQGILRGSARTYAAGDWWRITVTFPDEAYYAVAYWVRPAGAADWLLWYTSTGRPDMQIDLYPVDVALYDAGSGFTNITLERYAANVFRDAGSLRTYGPWPADSIIADSSLDTYAKRAAHAQAFFAQYGALRKTYELTSPRRYLGGTAVLVTCGRLGIVSQRKLIVQAKTDRSSRSRTRWQYRLTLDAPVRLYGVRDPYAYLTGGPDGGTAPAPPTGLAQTGAGVPDGGGTLSVVPIAWDAPAVNAQWIELWAQPVGGGGDVRPPRLPAAAQAGTLLLAYLRPYHLQARYWPYAGPPGGWCSPVEVTGGVPIAPPPPTAFAATAFAFDADGPYTDLSWEPPAGYAGLAGYEAWALDAGDEVIWYEGAIPATAVTWRAQGAGFVRDADVTLHIDSRARDGTPATQEATPVSRNVGVESPAPALPTLKAGVTGKTGWIAAGWTTNPPWPMRGNIIRYRPDGGTDADWVAVEVPPALPAKVTLAPVTLGGAYAVERGGHAADGQVVVYGAPQTIGVPRGGGPPPISGDSTPDSPISGWADNDAVTLDAATRAKTPASLAFVPPGAAVVADGVPVVADGVPVVDGGSAGTVDLIAQAQPATPGQVFGMAALYQTDSGPAPTGTVAWCWYDVADPTYGVDTPIAVDSDTFTTPTASWQEYAVKHFGPPDVKALIVVVTVAAGLLWLDLPVPPQPAKGSPELAPTTGIDIHHPTTGAKLGSLNADLSTGELSAVNHVGGQNPNLTVYDLNATNDVNVGHNLTQGALNASATGVQINGDLDLGSAQVVSLLRLHNGLQLAPATDPSGADVAYVRLTGATPFQLPAASSFAGQTYFVKNVSPSLSVNVLPDASGFTPDTIDGASSLPLVPLGHAILISDGVGNWDVW